MGLQEVPEIFVLVLHEKVGFCGKELKGEIHTWKGTNNRIFDLFFSNHIQFSKIKACFVQNYTDFYMKYFSHCRQVVFGF